MMRITALIVMALTLFAACGGGGSSSAADPQTALITSADMPDGWGDRTLRDDSPRPLCGKDLEWDSADTKEKAVAAFEYPGDIDPGVAFLLQIIERSSVDAAEARMRSVRDAIAGCASWVSVDPAGGETHWTTSDVVDLGLGDESALLAASGTGARTINLYVRVDDAIAMMMLFTTADEGREALVRTLAAKTAERLEGR